MSEGLLYLSRDDVLALLDQRACVDAVEEAFRAHQLGRLPAEPGVLGTHLPTGGLHVKTAALGADPMYVVAKANANFPQNPERFGLPTIQGLLLLFDGVRGTPLAVMDSGALTAIRTAAASAVAARYLARKDAAVLGLIGCGVQARAHVEAMRAVRPITRVVAFDADPARAAAFAAEVDGPAVEVAPSLEQAVAVDILVTCTSATRPFITPAHLRPGLFLAAVGADASQKHEIAPATLRASRVVADLLEQSATMGDLHHAIAAGVMTRDDVHATLGQVVTGERPGREGEAQHFIFDSTGTALQDVAAAKVAYEGALRTGRGTRLPRP